MNKLRELRSERVISQADLAAEVDCDRSTISYFENEKCMLSVGLAIRIADFFDVSIDYLLGRSEKRK